MFVCSDFYQGSGKDAQKKRDAERDERAKKVTSLSSLSFGCIHAFSRTLIHRNTWHFNYVLISIFTYCFSITSR